MDDKHEKHTSGEVHEESMEIVHEDQQAQIVKPISQNDDPLALQIAELLENEDIVQSDHVHEQEDREVTPADGQVVQSADEVAQSDEDKSDLLHAEDDGDEEQNHVSAEEEEELNRVIEELCTSKAEEFMLLGYEGVSGKDIWEFVSEPYHKTGIPPLHKLINDILSLRVTDYMNWLTLSAYKGLKFNE